MALIKEIRYTFLAHVFNVIVPLLLIPVLVHRLGEAQFGKFVILVGTSTYLAYIVELGFNNVAIERFASATPQGQRRIFMAVLSVKTLLAIIVCSAGVTVYSDLLKDWGWSQATAWLLVAPPLTCILYPAWFFVIQKRQRLNFFIQFSTKLFLLAGVLIFVHMPADAPFAVGIYSVSVLLVALPFAGNWTKYFSLDDLPSWYELREIASAGFKASGLAIRDAWSANGLAPILGVFLDGNGVAEFALAEKIARSLTAPASMVGSVILANYNALQRHIDAVRKHAVTIICGMACLYVLSVFAIKVIAEIYFSQYARSVELFLLMSGSVICAYLAYIFLNVIYVLGRRYLSLTFLVAAQCGFTVLVAWFFANNQQWGRAAFAITVIEVFVSIVLLIKFRRFNLNKCLGIGWTTRDTS